MKHTPKFRITPARRDFLRLLKEDDLTVIDNGQRFLRYQIKNQIKKSISRNTISKYYYAGLIDLFSVEILPNSSVRRLYKITPKGLSELSLLGV